MKTKLNDLIAFIAVAEEESFTRAAARLSVSQSALSHTIKGLEERLGLRLLTRTTRSVSLTEIGRKLYSSIAPRMQEIEDELDSLNALKDEINSALNAKKSALADAVLNARLETEWLDVTLPSRAIHTGSVHPISQVTDS